MSNVGPQRQGHGQAEPSLETGDAASTGRPKPALDRTTPNIARVYDWLLHGKDNYAVDREMGKELLRRIPQARDFAMANRYFLHRVVRFLAGECGMTQFIDVGAGLPGRDNVHEVARRVNQDVRVVYVDHDPVVLAHGRAMLANNHTTMMVEGDMRHPEEIIGHPETRRLIDFQQPVAVLLVSVLHFLSDEDAPYRVVDAFADVMAPLSYLAVSHALRGRETDDAAGLYRQKVEASTTLRSRFEIERFLDGFELVEPGLVPVPEWRPDFAEVPKNMRGMPFLGGVAWKR